MDYSLSEQLLPEKWIGGENIYRKVIPIPQLPNGLGIHPTVPFPHHIEAMGLLIKAQGAAMNPGAVKIPLPYAPDQSAAPGKGSVAFYVDNLNISVVAVQVDASLYSGHVILEYLKMA